MRMNDIKLLLTGNGGSHDSITPHLLHQVHPVFPGKLILVLKTYLMLFRPLMYALACLPLKTFRLHIGNQIRPHLHKTDILPVILNITIIIQSLHIARIDYLHCTLVLIPACMGHHKQDFHPLLRQPSGQTQTSSAKSSRNMRRKLPAKHQYFCFHNIPISICYSFIFSYLFTIAMLLNTSPTLQACEIEPFGI